MPATQVPVVAAALAITVQVVVLEQHADPVHILQR